MTLLLLSHAAWIPFQVQWFITVGFLPPDGTQATHFGSKLLLVDRFLFSLSFIFLFDIKNIFFHRL